MGATVVIVSFLKINNPYENYLLHERTVKCLVKISVTRVKNHFVTNFCYNSTDYCVLEIIFPRKKLTPQLFFRPGLQFFYKQPVYKQLALWKVIC